MDNLNAEKTDRENPELTITIPYECTVCGKKVSPKVICHFLSNRLEFLREILHVYYLFIYT